MHRAGAPCVLRCMDDRAQDGSMPYVAHLTLTAPGALPLRALLDGAAPRVVVTVKALETFLTARGARGKQSIEAIIAGNTELPDDARGEAGVLDLDGVVAVLISLGTPAAAKLAPEMLANFRDAEGVAMRTLARIARMKVYGAGVPVVVPMPAKDVAAPQNLSEHMQAERATILEALEATRWDRSKAAELVGMARRTFYRRMEDYGLLEGAKPRGKVAQQARMAAFAAERAQREGSAAPAPAKPDPKPSTKRAAKK